MTSIRIGFFSTALGMCVECSVILPQERKDGEKFSVLWLLHGMGGDHTDWVRQSRIGRFVEPLNMAVVMPSVQLSSYANMAYGGKFFDYVSEELPQKMQMFFPLSEKREDNFIAGLSMGGAGSMKIGLARPEQYAAIGCLSAGASNFGAGRSFSPFQQKILRNTYGDRDLAGTEEDVFFNAKRIVELGLPAPRIFHAIGADDYLMPQAKEAKDFFETIPGNPFDYTYLEAPGAHTWEFWDEYIQDFLRFIRKEA